MAQRITVVVPDSTVVPAQPGEFSRLVEPYPDTVAQRDPIRSKILAELAAGEAFVADWANKNASQKDAFFQRQARVVLWTARLQVNQTDTTGLPA